MWQNGVVIFCDSAHLFDDNSADAFSKIHIIQNDTLHLYGDILHYQGNTKIADIDGKSVVMKDKQMTLTTTHLNYDVNKKKGTYNTGAKIVNKENTLTSVFGDYYSDKKEYHFKKNVVLINPKYITKSDTLVYNTESRTAFFKGPTTIKGDSDFIYCENGWYNTEKNISQFNKKAYLINKNQILKGDSIYYDRDLGFGKGIGNVVIIDTTQKITVTGDYGEYYKEPGNTFITGHAVFSQKMDDDTLFLHADTLKAIYDSTNTNKTLYAFHKAKFYKKDLQGMSDSLIYSFKDSIIRMYKTPVLWSEENQLNAKYIEIRTKNKHIETIYMKTDAFIVMQKDSSRYDQVK